MQGEGRRSRISQPSEAHRRFEIREPRTSGGGRTNDRWGLLAAETKRKGTILSIIDGLLAATALHHNLTVVSRNASDFIHTPVPVLNPWLI